MSVAESLDGGERSGGGWGVRLGDGRPAIEMRRQTGVNCESDKSVRGQVAGGWPVDNDTAAAPASQWRVEEKFFPTLSHRVSKK